MIKLKSGYYQYKPNTGITFLDTHLYVAELSKDTIFVSPSTFHQIVTADEYNTEESALTFFKYNNDLLADLHFTHNIKGLYEY